MSKIIPVADTQEQRIATLHPGDWSGGQALAAWTFGGWIFLVDAHLGETPWSSVTFGKNLGPMSFDGGPIQNRFHFVFWSTKVGWSSTKLAV